jgi:hypothetical protein
MTVIIEPTAETRAPFAPDGHDGFGRPYYFLTVYPPEPDEYRTDFLQVRMVDCRSKRNEKLRSARQSWRSPWPGNTKR